jgi:hypothetical protein
MPSSEILRRVALVRSDVSEELSASIIRVTRIGELGRTLAVTRNRRTLRRNTLRNTEDGILLTECVAPTGLSGEIGACWGTIRLSVSR